MCSRRVAVCATPQAAGRMIEVSQETLKGGLWGLPTWTINAEQINSVKEL